MNIIIIIISSLAPAFAIIKRTKAENTLSFCIEEFLKSKMGNRIDFCKCYFEKRKKTERQTKSVL